MEGIITQVEYNSLYIKILKLDNYPADKPRPTSMLNALMKCKVEGDPNEDSEYFVIHAKLDKPHKPICGPIQVGLGIVFNPAYGKDDDGLVFIEHCHSGTIHNISEWKENQIARC